MDGVEDLYASVLPIPADRDAIRQGIERVPELPGVGQANRVCPCGLDRGRKPKRMVVVGINIEHLVLGSGTVGG